MIPNRKFLFPLFVGLLPLGTVEGQAQTDTLSLSKSLPIPEVVITTARHESDPRLAPMTLSVVERKSLQERKQASLLPILGEQVPGLFVTARGVMGYGVSTGAAGTISLRGVGGAPTTGVLFVIDGQPQYMGLMGHPIADTYLTHEAERVEVVRGPASVLYGSNALGGVVHIVTRRPSEEGFHGGFRAGYGSWNTLESSLVGDWQQGAFSVGTGGSYNRSDGHRPEMGFDQGGGTLRFGVELSPTWHLGANGECLHFNASNPGTLQQPLLENDSHITRYRAAIALRNQFQRGSGALTLFYSGGRHRINDGYAPGEEPPTYHFHSRDYMGGVSAYESLSLFAQNRTTIGFDWFHFGGKSWNRYLEDGHQEPIADREQDEMAAYVDFRQQVWSWLLVDLGLRVDHHSHVGTEWIPQASLTFFPTAQTEIRAILSKGFRFPTLRELFLFPSQNPDLSPERLWNYEVTFSRRHPRAGLRYGINLFYLRGQNCIQTQLIEGRPRNVNTGRIEHWGVEGEFSIALKQGLNLQGNYSYLHMRYPVLAAPEHKLYGALHYARSTWSLSTGLQYIHGLYTQLATASRPAHQEAFLLWNLRATYHPIRWLSLWLRGENLLAQRYEIQAGYPMPRATLHGGVEISF